jgi:predicted anti-sigma-YlaC factor YlaD
MHEEGKGRMGIKLTCKEVHRLVSERLDRRLSPVEHTRMRIHLVLCAACRNFEDQMQLIRGAMRRFDISGNNDWERKPE